MVEHILALVELLQDSPLELSRFIEEGVPEQYALPDGPSLRAACNLIQFMDEMPGGFLIYCAQEGERIIYANRWLLRIFQCENMAEFRELTGNSFRGMVHPEDLEEVEGISAIVSAMVAQRTALGLSQRDLAAVCGIPQSSVARIEACKTTPNLGTLLNIPQHLGLQLTVTPAN